jgi:predicted metal-dependent hydrolase
MDLREGFTPTSFVRERLSAKARNIRIEVRPDGQVWLIIPRHVSRRVAYDFLASRGDWIRLKLAEFDRKRNTAPPPLTLRWDGSDCIPLRGINTALLVTPARIARPVVRFTDAVNLLCPPAALRDPALLARTLGAALRQLARSDARHMLDEEAGRLGIDYTGPRIAEQKSLWGSCSPDGLISLNWRLVLAPREVFRYVIVHELCHRRHLNHSQRFWALVERQMPEFETWRVWLRRRGSDLHGLLPRGESAPPRRGQLDLFES